MLPTPSYQAVESLLGLCQKLSQHTGRTVETTQWYDCFTPFATSTWYCRTHVWSVSEEQAASLAQLLWQKTKKGEQPSLISFTQEEITPLFSRALEHAGFSSWESLTGMLLDLPSDFRIPPNKHVVRIGPDEIDRWSDVCAEAFGKEPNPAANRLLVADPSCRFYAYLENGDLAATLLLSLQPGNAGIHEVGTRKQYRGQGFCRALLQQAFSNAAKEGYPLVSLQASAAGEPIYRAVGMQPVSQICHYRYLG